MDIYYGPYLLDSIFNFESLIITTMNSQEEVKLTEMEWVEKCEFFDDGHFCLHKPLFIFPA